MGLERYVGTDEGFRKYVELMESTPTKKRQQFLDLAKLENPVFAEAVVKYILTFDRITKLQEGELAEVLGAEGLKPDDIVRRLMEVIPSSDDGALSRGKLPEIFGPADAR